jgi:hypothetical protein
VRLLFQLEHSFRRCGVSLQTEDTFNEPPLKIRVDGNEVVIKGPTPLTLGELKFCAVIPMEDRVWQRMSEDAQDKHGFKEWEEIGPGNFLEIVVAPGDEFKTAPQTGGSA